MRAVTKRVSAMYILLQIVVCVWCVCVRFLNIILTLWENYCQLLKNIWTTLYFSYYLYISLNVTSVKYYPHTMVLYLNFRETVTGIIL